MISVREIRKTYPGGGPGAAGSGRVRAVDGISFELRAGEVVGLLGPNGAGKSTTIRMITGYLGADGGSVHIDGFDAFRAPVKARRATGYLPEHAPLYPEMTPLGYLRYRARLCGRWGRSAGRLAEAAASRCGLSEMLKRRIGRLSKGYRQRVGLAAALVHEPRVLILDEPASGLDPVQIREMRALVRELAQDRTMLLSSHILDEVERTCDRVMVIARGKLRADGTPTELAERFGPSPRVVFQCKSDPSVLDPRATSSATGGGWNEGRLEPLQGEDPRGLAERIGATATKHGVALRELRIETATLEDAFIHLTDDAPQPRAKTPSGSRVLRALPEGSR
ncbi:MAG: ABC transporter ATP-binding protein [Planctomycetota bacterium]